MWFTSQAGINYTLTSKEAEPTDDDLLPEPVLTEAFAAAILNHPGFVAADADSPRADTITIQSRYLLVPDVDRGNALAPEDLSTPAVDVALAADRLLAGDPSDSERATADPRVIRVSECRVGERGVYQYTYVRGAISDRTQLVLVAFVPGDHRQHCQQAPRRRPRGRLLGELPRELMRALPFSRSSTGGHWCALRSDAAPGP
ncbi:hypothetical protein ACUJ8N_35035 [Streptomyces sp. ESR1.13]|uniref:hypothetical protein n=1 Tax=unclassified Streptomyces TaxID=2593676 RepID=UPI000A7A3762